MCPVVQSRIEDGSSVEIELVIRPLRGVEPWRTAFAEHSGPTPPPALRRMPVSEPTTASRPLKQEERPPQVRFEANVAIHAYPVGGLSYSLDHRRDDVEVVDFEHQVESEPR